VSPPFPLGYLPDSFELLAVVAVLTLSLMMTFVGSRLIQWLSFVIVGLMTASAGTLLGAYYLGPVGGVIGFVGGFVIGAGSTVLLLPAGMGMALGFVGYAVAQTFVGIAFVPVMVWLVGFAYGFLLTDLLLPAISAAVGGGLLFEVGLTVGLAPSEAFVFAVAITAAGVATQTFLARRARDLFGEPRVTYRNRRARNRQEPG
jgi:hypothetical protein